MDMHRALRPLPAPTDTVPSGPLQVPENLDDVEVLLALREQVEAYIVRAQDDVVLDCQALVILSGPVLGWLMDIAAMLSRHGRQLRLINTSAELRFQIHALAPRGCGARTRSEIVLGRG
jgi:anti-anti-sigma regulatory factor